MTKEPIFDIAHLAHVEIYSPKLEESVEFFKKCWGWSEIVSSRVNQFICVPMRIITITH